jgi:hypothetical protein
MWGDDFIIPLYTINILMDPSIFKKNYHFEKFIKLVLKINNCIAQNQNWY